MHFSSDKVNLGTFDFPKTGFWIVHAVAIAGLYYLGRKTGEQ